MQKGSREALGRSTTPAQTVILVSDARAGTTTRTRTATQVGAGTAARAQSKAQRKHKGGSAAHRLSSSRSDVVEDATRGTKATVLPLDLPQGRSGGGENGVGGGDQLRGTRYTTAAYPLARPLAGLPATYLLERNSVRVESNLTVHKGGRRQ